ncbi:hypothetical protein GEMRC1_011799 [Eukaryota sp. GEM-RC1]
MENHNSMDPWFTESEIEELCSQFYLYLSQKFCEQFEALENDLTPICADLSLSSSETDSLLNHIFSHLEGLIIRLLDNIQTLYLKYVFSSPSSLPQSLTSPSPLIQEMTSDDELIQDLLQKHSALLSENASLKLKKQALLDKVEVYHPPELNQELSSIQSHVSSFISKADEIESLVSSKLPLFNDIHNSMISELSLNSESILSRIGLSFDELRAVSQSLS